jgi:RNA recognition motif-containing protein
MSVRLYVGNLPKEAIERQALETLFVDAGNGVSTKLIKDRKTGKCRGFAFVTVPSDEMADQFIEKYNGQSFMDSPIKIEKALPRTKGKSKEEEEEKTEIKTDSETSTSSNSPSKRAKNNKRNNRRTNVTSSQNESIQPDPRWADKLTQFKEMLIAQGSN